MSSSLEWDKRHSYLLTELILFAISCIIVALAIVLSLIASYFLISRKTAISILRPIVGNVLPSAVAFTFVYNDDGDEKEGKGDADIELVERGRVKFNDDVERTREVEVNVDNEGEEEAEAVRVEVGVDQRNEAEISVDAEDNAEAKDNAVVEQGAKAKEKCKPGIKIVFLGLQERSINGSPTKKNLVRIYVHVYIIVLCGLIVLWAMSVFTDSVLYRKRGSCNDLSVNDTDLNCFLLSDRDVPEEVKDIINQDEEGEQIPCEEVQNVIKDNYNETFDLEVICYQYKLNPLAALGVAYGAMKVIAFFVVSALSLVFAFVDKCFVSKIGNGSTKNNSNQSLKNIDLKLIAVSHVLLFVISIGIVVSFSAAVGAIHDTAGLRNSAYDLLRGETFYRYSFVVLGPLTLLYIGFVPWWAFEPLDDPPDWDMSIKKASKKILTRKIYSTVNSILLHQKFSTPLANFLSIMNKTQGIK